MEELGFLNADEVEIVSQNKNTEIHDVNGNVITAENVQQTITTCTDLIQRAIDGEKSAFDELYMQSYRYVFFVVRQYIPDDETTYDAIQETFIKVYKNIRTLSSPEAFYSWISAIAKNTAIDILRTAHYKTTVDYDENSIGLSQDEKNTEVILDMEIVLKKLNPQDTELLSLVYYDGMRVSQIAKMQGVPATTVYSRLNKAKKNLKAQLAVHGIDKSVYSGNFVAMITTAIRNIIGTALLSFAIAQQILNSITGKNGKKELAIAKIIKLHQKKLALKIASWLVAVSMVASCLTVLTLTDWKVFKQKRDDTAKEVVETITEYHYHDNSSSDDNTSSENNKGFWQNLFGGNFSSQTQSGDDESKSFWGTIFGSQSDDSSENTSSNNNANKGFWGTIFGSQSDNSSQNTSSDENSHQSQNGNSSDDTVSEDEPTSDNSSSDNVDSSDKSSSASSSQPTHTPSSAPTPSDVTDGFVPDCDVSEYNVLGNNYGNRHIARQGDWFYYFTETDGISGLYKVKNDGTGRKCIVSGIWGDYLNVVGEWLYFENRSYIYRVHTDGSGCEKICDIAIKYLQVLGNIGYCGTGEGCYTIDLTTLESKYLCDGSVYFNENYFIHQSEDIIRIYNHRGNLIDELSGYGNIKYCYSSQLVLQKDEYAYIYDFNNLGTQPNKINMSIILYRFYCPYNGGYLGAFSYRFEGYDYSYFNAGYVVSASTQEVITWPFKWGDKDSNGNYGYDLGDSKKYAVFDDGYVYYVDESGRLLCARPDGSDSRII